MSNTIAKSLKRSRVSVKTQSVAAVAAIVAAVALPQLLHGVGAAMHLGTALGERYLPMYLPILLVGMLAGPFAGAAAGLLGPLLSYALTGMPGTAMLPIMMAELSALGLVSGLIRRMGIKLPEGAGIKTAAIRVLNVVIRVAVAQLAVVAARTIAVMMAVYMFNSQVIMTASIWKRIIAGVPGIIIQFVIIPAIVLLIGCDRDEQ